MKQTELDDVLSGRDVAFGDRNGHVYVTGMPSTATLTGTDKTLLIVWRYARGTAEKESVAFEPKDLLSDFYEPSAFVRSFRALGTEQELVS